MSIERTLPSQPVAGCSHSTLANAQQNSAENAVKSVQKPQPNGTEVTLSDASRLINPAESQDVNAQRVAAIKASLEQGDLNIDCDKIAEALLDNSWLTGAK